MSCISSIEFPTIIIYILLYQIAHIPTNIADIVAHIPTNIADIVALISTNIATIITN